MIRRIAISALASVIFGLGLAQLASATELAPPPPRHAPKAPRHAAAPPPAPAPAPAPNYTGFYAGLNGGGGFENTINNSAFSTSGLGLAFDIAPLVPGQLNTRPSGFIGGGQIGYNWQAGLFVWGVETDFQGANIAGSATVTNSITRFTITDTVTAAGSQRIDWFGTLRGRLGWTPTPPLLIYATGGLAYGQVKTNVSFTGSEFDPSPSPGTTISATSAVTKTDTRAGWTVGGGAEWMFTPQWSIKAEYLFYDLGTESIDQRLVFFSGGGFTAIHSDAHYRGSIVRGGVNFKFY
jgi:outer membrane immunogenic protein